MCATASVSSRQSRPSRWAFVLHLLLATCVVTALEFAVPARAAPVNLKMALANLGRPAPVAVQAARAVGAFTAGAVLPNPTDEIFAQGFDNTNSQCVMSADCPDTGAECLVKGCSNGLCNSTPKVTETACSGGVCDGSGACVGCLFPSDCPSTGSECLDKTCTAGTCTQTAVPMSTVCSGGFCNAFGTCVQCLAAGDCPNTGSECIAKICTAGACTPTLEPAGTACSTGVCNAAGTCVQCLANADCAAGFCSAAGTCVQCLNNAQCPDASECKIESCTAGACVQQNAAAGTACSNNGVCDGSGLCIVP